MSQPFALPRRLPPDLERIRAYWRGLLRGSAKIPFADDASLADLPDLKARLAMIDVFDRPQRFRLAIVGAALGAEGDAGRYLDETELAPPLDFLAAQCSVTVEAGAPTFHHSAGYGRLVLPLWGDGRIAMLIAGVEPD